MKTVALERLRSMEDQSIYDKFAPLHILVEEALAFRGTSSTKELWLDNQISSSCDGALTRVCRADERGAKTIMLMIVRIVLCSGCGRVCYILKI